MLSTGTYFFILLLDPVEDPTVVHHEGLAAGLHGDLADDRADLAVDHADDRDLDDEPDLAVGTDSCFLY